MEEEVVLHVREITQRRASTFAVLGLADAHVERRFRVCVSDETGVPTTHNPSRLLASHAGLWAMR